MRTSIILAALLLTSCSQQPIYKPFPVDVAVPVPCITPEVKKPVFAIDSIRATNTLFEQVQAILATDQQRRAYEAELVAANNKCQGKEYGNKNE